MKSIRMRVIAVAAALLPLGVSAAPIEGEIGFNGALLSTCSTNADPCSLADADGLDIYNDSAIVVFATGDFASTVSPGDLAAMNDFIFSPFAGVDPVWSVGGFNLALETLVVVSQSSNGLVLTGTGRVSGPGFDTTMVNWSFSADTTGASVVSWSSTATAVIPVPAALWLMIGAVGALVGFRRGT